MMKKMAFSVATLFLSLVPTLFASNVIINVSNTLSEQGVIIVRLISASQKDSFPEIPDERSVCHQKKPASLNAVTFICENIPPGRYAVIAIHDANSNGEMDHRFGMMPLEKWGMSNNVRFSIFRGVPDFEDAAFSVGENDFQVTISVE